MVKSNLKVKFKGKSIILHDSDDPYQLVIGRIYEVIDELVYPYHTIYLLKDCHTGAIISGYFDSRWFEAV